MLSVPWRDAAQMPTRCTRSYPLPPQIYRPDTAMMERIFRGGDGDMSSAIITAPSTCRGAPSVASLDTADAHPGMGPRGVLRRRETKSPVWKPLVTCDR